MSAKESWRRLGAACASAAILGAALFLIAPVAAQPGAADLRVGWVCERAAWLDINDLQGRQSLQSTTRSDAANGNWAYVGHSPNDRDPKKEIAAAQFDHRADGVQRDVDPRDLGSGQAETRVAHPRCRGPNHRSVSVVYDYKHDSPAGRDYLIRSFDTGKDMRFQVYDITDRAKNPKAISLVSEIKGTPPNSCGPGCGGTFMHRAHKGYWSEESGYYYAAAGEPGFRNTSLQIFDLRDPKNPKWVGRGWLRGMKDTEDKALYEGQYVHHPIVDEAKNRVYIGFRGSGWLGAWDITDRANPKMVWAYDAAPPAGGPHTVTPIVVREPPLRHGPGAAQNVLPGDRRNQQLQDRYDGQGDDVRRHAPRATRCRSRPGRYRLATSATRAGASEHTSMRSS